MAVHTLFNTEVRIQNCKKQIQESMKNWNVKTEIKQNVKSKVTTDS